MNRILRIWDGRDGQSCFILSILSKISRGHFTRNAHAASSRGGEKRRQAAALQTFFQLQLRMAQRHGFC